MWVVWALQHVFAGPDGKHLVFKGGPSLSKADPKDNVIDYHAAVTGALCLVPSDAALEKLAADYQHMVDDGLLLDDAEPFSALLEQCRAIQELANKA